MRKIAIVLIFLLLIQALPIGSFDFASSLSPVDLVNMDEAEIEALSDTDIYNAITSSDNYPPTVEAKLKNGGSTDNVTVSLNINSYRKYRLIVYGVPFEKESKYPGKTLPGSEPKFLGFNEKGIPVTNDKSPSLPGDKEPYEKKWNHYTNQYEKTWTDVSNEDASGQDISALYKHLLLSGTINDDASDNYTLAYILYGVMGDLKKYLGSDEDTLREKLESVVQLQMLPTFVSKGSFKMTHNTVTNDNPTGSKRYDTMEWERLGDIKEYLTIVPEKKKIIMFPERDEVTNKFTVTVHYDDKVSGMDTSALIKSPLQLNLGKVMENVNKKNPTFTFTKTYKRDEYKFGTYDIEETGGFYFESIFGDKYDEEGKANFELEVKMQGDLAVDFITKHDSKLCDDYLNPIVLNEGSWDSSDDIVKIDLEDKSIISQALVNEIPDARIISWNWFVKNKDGSFEQFNSTLTPNISYDLTFGSDYTFNTVKEDGKVETVVQFKLEVMDSQGNTGQMIKNVKIGEKTVIPPPPLPVSKKLKPHAIAKVKAVVKAGEKVWADGRDSYDSDGRIVSYDWDSPHSVFPEADDEERVYFYAFNVTENSELRLKIKDNDDFSDSEELKYDVVNPISPVITQTGFRKVNRKINLNVYKSRGTKYFPIQWDKTEWKITPMEGQSMDSIKIDGDLSGASIDTLFKETGKYKVWMKLYATCTYEDEEYSYSNETEQFIWIKPDEAPISNINVKKLTYRNPDTDGVAILQVADDSRSLDGDFIENKKWWFAFDSDNDDSFEDEEFVLISDGNENVIHQSVNHVGKYLFKLEVKETFGQPTIDKFVTDTDRKRDDNRDVEESLRIVEVKNVAPIVELNIEPREAVEVVVFYDSGQETKLEMEAEFERLNMELMERRMRTNINLVDVSKDKFSIGDTVTNFYNYYRNLYVTFKYEKYTKEYHEDKDQHKNKDISPYIPPLFSVLIEKIVRSEEEYTSLPTIAEGTARVFYERSRTKSKDRTIDIYGYTFDDPEVGSGNGSNVFEVRTLHKTDDYKEIIHGSPDISYDFDNNYRVGLKDHEEISEYKVANIDKFINDELRDEGSNKYAVFITDSKASFHMMTDNTRKLLSDKNYKLRFSMKKEYLESGPRLPQVLDVKIGKNNKTYYLTPYGNIISVGGEVVGGDGDVYYKYEDGLRWQDIEENLTGITRWQDMDELSPITDITCNKGACKRIYIDPDKNLKVEGYDFTFDTEIDSFYYFDTLLVWEKEGVVKASSYDVTKGRFSNPDTLMNTSIKSIRAKRISGYSTYGIVKSSTDNLSNFVCIEGSNNESIVIESGHYTKITYHEDAWETGYNDYWMNNKNLYRKYKVKKSDLKIVVYDNKEDEYRNYRNEEEFWRQTWIRRNSRKYNVWVIEEYSINWNNKDYTENANDTVKVIGTIDETKKYIRQTIALQDGIPIVIRIGEDYIAEGFGNAKYGGLGNFYKSGYSKPDQTKRNKIDTREKHRYYSRKNRIYGDIISKNSREGGLRGNENYKSIPYYSKDWLPSIKTNQTLDTAFSTSIFNYMSAYDMIAYNIYDKVYDEDIKKLVDGIVSDNDGKIDRENAYVLLGTKANMKTFYSDYEDDDLYDYRWDLVHDEKFFENDLGKDPKAKLNGEPIEVFDYTGHYKIELKVRDNPVGEDDRFDNYRLWNKDKTTLNVYVHRKPRVRDGLYAKKTDGKLHVYAADEGSYDLDHLSQSNKGIRSHDWYWRTDRNRIWKNEKLDLRDAEYNTTYYISHRVKDEEGVWSDFSSKEIIIGEDIPVVITANIDAYLNSKFDIDKIPVDEKISVKDIKVTYYDDVNLIATLEKNGSVIKELLNKDSNISGVSKDDTGFIYEDIIEKLPHNLDDGDYSVKLVARDLSYSSKSASVNLPFKINTPIELRAVLPDQAVVGEKAKISCSSSKYTDSVELTAFNDDNSIKTKYNMKLDKESGDRKIWTADVDIPWSCKDRDYEFKFVGTVETDTPKSEELIEDMRIVVLEIVEIGIKGYWNHWRGQENMFGERMTVEPHRFLSHETVIIYGYVAGNPDKVYVEFSPQLEAMFFTDPAGNVYSYEEDIGYTVDFPLDMPLEKWRYYEVEYQLPIAWTTIDWDNKRVRDSYWMKITAEKSGVKVSHQFDDIEITGTVYDLLYVQPYHKPDK